MKYIGSKARFAKDIYNIICKITPRNGRAWVEPFAGGMNMMCNVPDEDGPRLASDSNEYLIDMFKWLSNGWIPPRSVSRDYYDECKKLVTLDKHIIGYVGFNCSYSGKWFGGYAGKVKTKTGLIRDYQDEAFRNMEKQISKLKNVEFVCSPYNELCIPNNSIIYCDPPYYGTTKYKDDFDHEVFWDWVRDKSTHNDVFISEYSAPDDFECIWSKTASSSLSSNGVCGGNKISTERLFKIKYND